jgi:hypothetical protein
LPTQFFKTRTKFFKILKAKEHTLSISFRKTLKKIKIEAKRERERETKRKRKAITTFLTLAAELLH